MPMKYSFVVARPLGAAAAERMTRFLADAMAKRQDSTVGGTFRILPPEEVGKRLLIDPTAMAVEREAS